MSRKNKFNPVAVNVSSSVISSELVKASTNDGRIKKVLSDELISINNYIRKIFKDVKEAYVKEGSDHHSCIVWEGYFINPYFYKKKTSSIYGVNDYESLLWRASKSISKGEDFVDSDEIFLCEYTSFRVVMNAVFSDYITNTLIDHTTGLS